MFSPERPVSIRTRKKGRSDSLFRFLVLAGSLSVVAVLLVVPLLTGSPSTAPNQAIARSYEQPFRDAFDALLFWLRMLKWIAAGVFACVVATALVLRRRSNTALTDDAAALPRADHGDKS